MRAQTDGPPGFDLAPPRKSARKQAVQSSTDKGQAGCGGRGGQEGDGSQKRIIKGRRCTKGRSNVHKKQPTEKKQRTPKLALQGPDVVVDKVQEKVSSLESYILHAST